MVSSEAGKFLVLKFSLQVSRSHRLFEFGFWHRPVFTTVSSVPRVVTGAICGLNGCQGQWKWWRTNRSEECHFSALGGSLCDISLSQNSF